MNKQQQDLSWACLSKEARHKIISVYACKNDSNTPYNEGYRDALRQLYGHHNLTSNTEPEEMLMAKRREIQNLFYRISCKSTIPTIKGELQRIFGDKCLPDKEPKQLSIQVGDKVTIKGQTVIRTVRDIAKNGLIKLEGKGSDYSVDELAPYTEPETKENMKQTRKLKPIDEAVKVFLSTKEEETEFRALLNENGYKWASGYSLIEISYWRADSDRMIHFVYPQKFVTHTGSRDNSITFSDFKEKYLKPEYRNLSQFIANCDKSEDNQLKDNMEEKELNLCELLKGCEDMELYSLLEGVAVINTIDDLITTYGDNKYGEKGNIYVGGECLLYPSRALYEKYPLDPYSAWMEWKEKKEQEKKKRNWWRAEYGNRYWYIGNNYKLCSENDYEWDDANMRYDMGNYFRTEEEARQASEAVMETLMKFHQKNQEK